LTKNSARVSTEAVVSRTGALVQLWPCGWGAPRAVESELTTHITHEETAESTSEIANLAIDSDAVARAIAYAIEQPKDVDTNEIILRPTAQPL